MSEIIFPEWRSNNQQVRYPFRDGATLHSSRGIDLAQSIFVDARLYPIGAVAGIFLNRISVVGSSVTVAIADSNGELATVTFDAATSTSDSLELFDRYGRPAGILASDTVSLAGLTNFGAGDTTFLQAATEFCSSVAIPMPQYGVVGILVGDTLFAGDVWLVGTNGVVLRVVDGALRIDVVGDPYAKTNDCVSRGVVPPPVCGLKTINNINGDPVTGDFKLFPGANIAHDNMIRIVQGVDGSIGVASAITEGCGNGS